MDKSGMGKEKESKGLIHKTWERCRSFGSGAGGKKYSNVPIDRIVSKPKSWPCTPESSEEGKQRMKRRVAPQGCFSVYVGAHRQRFVIKTDCINHPLFRMLLEEAELEYGHNSQGPLVLPCDVDIFYRVLSEMEGDEVPQGCTSFTKRYGSYNHVNPYRELAMNQC